MISKRDIFLLAAEKQFLHSIDGSCNVSSMWSCINIGRAKRELYMDENLGSIEEKEMYAEVFKPDYAGVDWWSERIVNKGPDRWDLYWDYESRILALLLMAEMLRPEKKKRCSKKQ